METEERLKKFLYLSYDELKDLRDRRKYQVDSIESKNIKSLPGGSILTNMNNIRDMLEDGILLLNSIASSTSQDGEINSHSEIIAIVQRSIEILLKGLASQASLQEMLLESVENQTNAVLPAIILKQELLESSENHQTSTNSNNSFKLKNENDQEVLDFCGAIKDDDSFDDISNTCIPDSDIKLETELPERKTKEEVEEFLESDLTTEKGKKRRNRKKGPLLSCTHCDRKFSCQSLFQEHLRRHLGEKPFKCDQCFKDFLTKGNLKEHMKIHTGEKSFQCNFCTKKCVRKLDLERHIMTHTGEKPFKCEHCFMEFTTNSNLVKHVRTHTGEKPYSCNICQKAFSSKVGMVEHKRGHTGDKPYSCDICQKSFSRTKHLQRHMQIHTGIKPFQCEICEKSFTRKENLKGHMNTHARVKAE